MSTRIASKGAIAKYAATATPTNVIPGTLLVGVTPGSRAMIKATGHDDANTDQYIARPLRDTVVVDITIAYDPANTHHEAIRAAHAAGTLHYLTIVLPDAGAAEWAMSGYWTDFGVPTLDPEDGLLKSVLKYKAATTETFTQ